VYGTNLLDVSTVAFEGARATVLSNTGTSLTVRVPVGTKNGRISVDNGIGKAISKEMFRVTKNAVSLTST
jgi:hypothetical protein